MHETSCPYHSIHEDRFDKDEALICKSQEKLVEIRDSLTQLQTQFIMYSENNIKEINKINECLATIKIDLTRMKIITAVAAVKQSGWGMLGGMVPMAVAIAIWFIQKG